MSDSFDSLEAELAAFVPLSVSPELRHGVAEVLASALPWRRSLWLISISSGLAAACLLAAFLFWKVDRHVEPELNIVQNPPAKVVERPQSTLLTYHQALAQSPEELDKKTGAFAWPLGGAPSLKVSTTIPPDLLD